MFNRMYTVTLVVSVAACAFLAYDHYRVNLYRHVIFVFTIQQNLFLDLSMKNFEVISIIN